MFSILSAKKKETNEHIIDNEIIESFNKIKDRIALAENKIKEEIDSLLKDTIPTDFEIEIKILRDYSNSNYKQLMNTEGTLSHVGIITNSHVQIKLTI